jgi:hypothetical protein
VPAGRASGLVERPLFALGSEGLPGRDPQRARPIDGGRSAVVAGNRRPGLNVGPAGEPSRDVQPWRSFFDD